MSKFKFEKYDDPFRAFSIQMSIICDLEQGGKIDENEAFEQVKALYNNSSITSSMSMKQPPC